MMRAGDSRVFKPAYLFQIEENTTDLFYSPVLPYLCRELYSLNWVKMHGVASWRNKIRADLQGMSFRSHPYRKTQ